MSESSRVTRVTIPEEMRRKLDALADTKMNAAPYSPEVDAAILEYWPIKRKEDLAKALGYGLTQVRKRYKELTDGEV